MAAGPGAADTAAALGGHGVATVHVAEHDALATHAPAALGRSLTELAGRLSSPAVVGPGTERGNEVLAHAAAIGDLPLAANCTAVVPGERADGDPRALGRQPARGGARRPGLSSC